MSPFIGYHATRRRHREGIQRYGLIACYGAQKDICGVYVFNDDYHHFTFGRSPLICTWGTGVGKLADRGASQDCWRVAYIGPMMPDEFVENGMVLLESVPPEWLSLITPITDNTGHK